MPYLKCWMWGEEQKKGVGVCDREKETIKNEPSRHFSFPLLTSPRPDEWIFMFDPDTAAQQRQALQQISLRFWCSNSHQTAFALFSGNQVNIYPVTAVFDVALIYHSDGEQGDASITYAGKIWTTRSGVGAMFLCIPLHMYSCVWLCVGQTVELRTVKAVLITSCLLFPLTQHPDTGI